MKIEDIFETSRSNITRFLEANPDWVIIICWPTASGKTKLSLMLAEWFGNMEIIGADSRQIYKYMDIWTDKVGYKKRWSTPHHQIDIIYPDQFYTVWQRKKTSLEKISGIKKRWNIPVIVWGTGLYIDSIYKNLDIPEVPPDFWLRDRLYQKESQNPWYLHSLLTQVDPKEAEKIHPNTTRYIVRALEIYYKLGVPKSSTAVEKLPDYPLLMISMLPSKNFVNEKIKLRTENMFENWLLDEIKFLLDKGYDKNLQAMNWIGYKQWIKYLEGEYTLEEAIEDTKKDTMHFAKKQRTWFRRYLRDRTNSPKDNVEYLFFT